MRNENFYHSAASGAIAKRIPARASAANSYILSPARIIIAS
jgi:hypothetical protein